MVNLPSTVKIIKTKDQVDKNLSLKFYADDLFDYIEQLEQNELIIDLEQNELIIDFNGFETASCSFTQRFLYRLARCTKNIKIIN